MGERPDVPGIMQMQRVCVTPLDLAERWLLASGPGLSGSWLSFAG
jgi:hypothetical protein